MLTRRAFSALSFSAAAGAALGIFPRAFARRQDANPAAARSMLFDWKDTVGGAKVAFGQGGNVLVVMSRGESIVVDSKVPGFGDTLRREAESFGSPIRLVVNTHHHWDHVGGNHAFTVNLPVFAHTNARQRIVDQVDRLVAGFPTALKALEAGKGAGAKGDQAPPQRVIDEVKALIERVGSLRPEDFANITTISKSPETATIGNLKVELHHFGPGHTDNDLVVFFPELNLMHMGDLLFHRNHPFIDLPAGATTKGWQNSLRKAIELCNGATVVVPGHGELTNRDGLQGQIDYFDKMREIVRHAKDVESMTKEEVMKLNPGPFADYGLTQILPRTLGGLYDELSAEKK